MAKSSKVRGPLSVLAEDPQGGSLGLELPPGALIDRPGRRGWWREPEPLLWVSDEAVGLGALAAQRSPALAAAGLQAVLFQGRRGLERWWQDREFSPERMSDPDDHHVEPVLREFWSRVVPDPEEGKARAATRSSRPSAGTGPASPRTARTARTIRMSWPVSSRTR